MAGWLGVTISTLVLISVLGPQTPAAASGPAKAPAPVEAGSRDYASDRAIVGIVRAERSAAADTIEDEGGDIVDYDRTGSFFVVETSSDSAEWSEAVEDDGAVRYAEPDWKISAADLAPADPAWGKLWGHTQIEAPAAWRTTTGSNDVVVGVIDSGVDYRHEDLAAQMWVNRNEDPTTPGDDDGNGFKNDVHGIDCVNDDSDPMDDNGHGTHVAGTIGAAANNGKGIAGVAWNVKLMALKFLDADGTGYTSDAIQCLHYAINNGAHVTNNSWGGAGFSRTLQDAIRVAGSRNQLFVAAAGNDGADNSTQPHYPSSYDLDNVISVAASGRDDALASFSNYGSSSVDLAAPGVGILSTVPNGYASYSGTSMAAPHVAGTAALLLAADPSLRSNAPGLRVAILDNVDPVPSLKGKVGTGGRLNVARAVWPDAPTAIHIHDIATSLKSIKRRVAKATVTIAVATENEDGITGARVSLRWSTGGTPTCITDEAGICSVSKRVKKTVAAKLKVSVTSVSHDSLLYDAAAGHTSEGLSRIGMSV